MNRKQIKKEYPRGTRLQLIFMNDPYGIKSGTKGTVKSINNDGMINIKWDNNKTLGLFYNSKDKFIKI